MTDQPPIDREAFKQFERTGYSRVAEVYGKTTAQVTSQLNDAVLKRWRPKAVPDSWMSPAAPRGSAPQRRSGGQLSPDWTLRRIC
jgi:hypothetical protein